MMYYDVDGANIATENALGYISTNVFDAVARCGNGKRFADRTTYVYDSRGLRIQSRNAAGFLSTTSYDPLGRQIAEQNPLGQTTTSVYDAANRTVATENALGSLHHQLRCSRTSNAVN